MRRPLRVAPAVHGGPNGHDDAGREVYIDFSTSVNAYGPAASVLAAVRDCCNAGALERYPDPVAWELRERLAAWTGVNPAEVHAGAGAAELLQLVCTAFLEPGDVVVVPPLAFGEYVRNARLRGARVIVAGGARRDRALHLTLEHVSGAFRDAVTRHQPRLAFLCSPENPTGRAWPREVLYQIADDCARSGTLLVLDQAYDAFVERPLGTPALRRHRAVIHLRSLTKDHALAGLRAAFAVASRGVVTRLADVSTPWSVSTMAQAAMAATCSTETQQHVAETARTLRQSARVLAAALAAAGFAVTASDTHYFVAEVPAEWRSAAEFRSALLDQCAIKVRDCASFGLPRHIRVAARTADESAAFLRALHTLAPRPSSADGSSPDDVALHPSSPATTSHA